MTIECWMCGKETERVPICISCILRKNLISYLNTLKKYVE